MGENNQELTKDDAALERAYIARKLGIDVGPCGRPCGDCPKKETCNG